MLENFYRNTLMNNLEHLPNNWIISHVKDISLKIQYGYTTSATDENTGIKFLRITDIQGYKVNWNDVPFCHADSVDAEKFLLSEGEIVFARTGATVGKSYLISGSIPKAVFASYLIRIILSKEINPNYIFYFFQSADYWTQIGIKAIGIGQSSVNAISLAQVAIPICSLAEQARIVNRIDELYSELDDAQISLEKARDQLNLYKLVLLKNAFEGKLTSEWRKNSRSRSAYDYLKKVSVIRRKKYEELTNDVSGGTGKRLNKNYDFEFRKHETISSWAIAKLDKLITITARVGWKGLKKEEYTSNGPLFLSVHALNYGKQVDFTDAQHISMNRYNESPEIMLRLEDILLCKDGSGIGKVGIVKHLPSKTTINSSLLIIRGEEVFTSDFLYYLMLGPQLQSIVSARITGSAIPHLFQQDIKEFVLMVPPIEEQKQIVQEIEYRLTILDDLERTIKSNLQKIEEFKYTLLKKSFEGGLSFRETDDTAIHALMKEIKMEQKKYSLASKVLSKSKPQRKKVELNSKTIVELLREAKTPVPAKELWLNSIHKDDIEAFYADIKANQDQLIELKQDSTSLISLKQ